ncbi:MAG TPA: flippase [Terrimicrobiaceae bacterium]
MSTLLRQRLDVILSRRLGANYFCYFDSIFWLASEKALQFALALFVGAYVARFLGPDQYGLLGYAQGVVSIAAAITTLGIDNIVVRQLVIDSTKRDEYLSAAALLRLIVGLFFVVLAAIYCAASSFSDSSPHLILIMTLALPFSAIGVLALDLQAIVALKQAALARASHSVISSLLRLMSALFKFPLVALAWINALDGPLFGTLLVGCHRWVAPAVRFKIPRLSTLAYLCRQGWPLLLSSISVILYMKMDQIMLKFMCGDLETGIYLAAVRLSELWNFIPVIICSSVYPSILKAREGDSVKYARRMQLLYDGLYFLSVASAVFSTLFAAPIVKTLFGSAYLASIPVLQVHIWSTIAVFLGVALGQWLLAEGLQLISVIGTALGLLVNLMLNLVLIPNYGALGAAFATTVSYSVAVFAPLLLTHQTRAAFNMLLRSVFLHRIWR